MRRSHVALHTTVSWLGISAVPQPRHDSVIKCMLSTHLVDADVHVITMSIFGNAGYEAAVGLKSDQQQVKTTA